MPNLRSIYDRLARLLAYHENSAETIRAQIRDLGRGEADRIPVEGLGVTVRAAAAYHARQREADRHVARPRGTARNVVARRTTTARALAQFDARDPRRPETLPIPVPGLGALVRRGYLIPKAGGYIRSSKPYRVNPTARA